MGPAIEKIEAFSKVKRPRHEAIFGLKWCMFDAILRKRVSIYRKKAEETSN